MRAFATGSMAVLALARVAAGAPGNDTWTGNESTGWNTAGNWLGGFIPTTAYTATFTGAPTANQPDLTSAGPGIGKLDFQSAGWTISSTPGHTLSFSGSALAIVSSGEGVNTLNTAFNDSYLALTFQSDTSNTLVFKKTFTQRRIYTLTGTGTIVFERNTTNSGQNWNCGPGTVLSNGPEVLAIGPTTVPINGTFGGTVATVQIQANRYSPTFTLANGAHLSPGGNGTFGGKISTMTLQTSSAATKTTATMGGTSSSLVIDIGSTVGSNDRLVLALGDVAGSALNLASCELALRGDGPLQDGDYTIITKTSGGYAGTFGRVTYNGAPANPSNFTVTYPAATSVVVSVSGLGASKGTVVLLR